MRRERWRFIPGQPNYEVSDRGRVRRGTRGKGTRKGRLKRHFQLPNGYLAVDFWHDGKHSRLYVHQAVALAFIGRCPSSKHEIAHWDGKRSNNYYRNLHWALPVDNHKDTRRHGRLPMGSKHANSKLTEASVKRMRKLRATGMTLDALGKRFGVTLTNVDLICRRVTWKHI